MCLLNLSLIQIIIISIQYAKVINMQLRLFKVWVKRAVQYNWVYSINVIYINMDDQDTELELEKLSIETMS